MEAVREIDVAAIVWWMAPETEEPETEEHGLEPLEAAFRDGTRIAELREAEVPCATHVVTAMAATCSPAWAGSPRSHATLARWPRIRAMGNNKPPLDHLPPVTRWWRARVRRSASGSGTAPCRGRRRGRMPTVLTDMETVRCRKWQVQPRERSPVSLYSSWYGARTIPLSDVLVRCEQWPHRLLCDQRHDSAQ